MALLHAAGASAATRFAAPGAIGAASSACPAANPCSLFAAAAADAPETAVRFGDEVVLAPGRYTDAAGDLGPQRSVTLAPGIDLHGAAGAPRPVIANGADVTLFSGLVVQGSDRVSHLEIQSGALNGITVRDGIVEDMVVRSQSGFASACFLGDGTIRDSACFATGPSARAVVVSAAGVGTVRTPRLRNVTAIATGINSTGLSGTATGGARTTLDAKAVIAQGADRDVRVSAVGAPSSAVLTFERSDYDSALETPEGGGFAMVSVPGLGTNITAAPQLAADGLHQLPTSPTVDRGVTDASSGAADVDGQARTIDGLADIGADELAHTTRASLACPSGEVEVGAPVECAVTVEDTSPGPISPAGEVVFAGDRGGAFDPAPGRCVLQAGAPGLASCRIAFSPAEAGMQAISVEYVGDGSHEPAMASAELSVFAPQGTETSLACDVERRVAACTATVTDVSPAPGAPGGTVSFETDGDGTFGGDGSCTLVADGAAGASCEIAYSVGRPGAHRLAASYSGDPRHLPSEGSTSVEFQPDPDPDPVPPPDTPPKAPKPPEVPQPPDTTAQTPDTILQRKPARKTARRRARFAFVSSLPGSTFQCRLDQGPFRPCRPPFAKQVKPGRHAFRVRAVGPGGSADPTPAIFRWTVSRPLRSP